MPERDSAGGDCGRNPICPIIRLEPNCIFFSGIFRTFKYFIQRCFICRPSHSTVPEEAEIEPRTSCNSAFAARRSNHSARSHPPTRPELVHNSARFHPHSARSHPHSRLDLIHNLGYISSKLG
jgi:hypothetical protein